MFLAENIFTNECDERDEVAGTTNFFLATNYVTDAYLTLDLGDCACLASIILRNTKNAQYNK